MVSVVLIANSSWYLSNFRISTILGLCDRGYRVTLIAPDSREIPPEILRKVRFCKWNGSFSDSSIIGFIKSCAGLFFTLRPIGRGVIFSFTPVGNIHSLLVGGILGFRVIPNVSGLGRTKSLAYVPRLIYQLAARILYKSAFHVFFQNRDDFDELCSKGWVDSSKADVLPGSGVNLKMFSPTRRQSDSRIEVLMACRLLEEKGVRVFMQAAEILSKQYPEFGFSLAGIPASGRTSIDEQEIVEFAETNDFFVYYSHVRDMPKLLATCDVFVLPTWYSEGIPRSLLEAGASAKVLIATSVRGVIEIIVNGETGCLIRPGSVTSLVDVLINVRDMSHKERWEMGERARKKIENRFDESIVVQEYINIL